MFRRLGLLAARYPLQIVAAWIVMLVGVLATTPKLSDVVSSSQASYLPSRQLAAGAGDPAASLPRQLRPLHAQSWCSPARQCRVVAEADYSGLRAPVASPAPFAVASDSLTPELRGALDSRDGAGHADQPRLAAAGLQHAPGGLGHRSCAPTSPPIRTRGSSRR